ncbi:CDP-glucose 4,6-dehydratase [Synechococcus sp. LTW-G]
MADQKFWAGKRVLLTGHTGFKGSWLALWLRELGAHITGVGLEPDTTPNLFGKLELERRLERHHIADIRDPLALVEIAQSCQPDVVLHLAAQPLVRRSYRDPLGTWATNVQGSLHLLEALKSLNHLCAVVMVTTDKVYANRECPYGYRETDRLGGHDPYSASKAAAELAIASWRESFCGDGTHQTPNLRIATARAGNVIGGGDWATDRIVPDAMRALAARQPIPVRNPTATRPWQHVLEPLNGYLLLAQQMLNQSQPPCDAFNFGPTLNSNRSVADLVQTMLQHWNGTWVDAHDASAPHEAGLLHLQIDKAHHQLGWRPRWDFDETLERTVRWYKDVHDGADPFSRSLVDLQAYQAALAA